MFLTPPTVEELLQSDLQDLVDMLAIQTTEYTRLFKQEGFSKRTLDQKEIVKTIQLAIDKKLYPEKTPAINQT